MSEIILHHYQMSPFSEKVRLACGLKKLAYKQVIVPIASPKPDLVALTGGYRRAPMMQIGVSWSSRYARNLGARNRCAGNRGAGVRGARNQCVASAR